MAEAVSAVYERLTADALLSRCLKGLTHNANESLHAQIWHRCPKHVFALAGRKRVELASTQAISSFNLSRAGLHNIITATEEEEELEVGLEEEGTSVRSSSRLEVEVDVAEAADAVADEDRSGSESDEEIVLERDQELDKIAAFLCKCKLKLASGETGCIKQFSQEWIHERCLAMNELSDDAKDYYIKGFLDSPAVADTEFTKHKRESTSVKRKPKQRTYLIHGNSVCRPALFIHCLGNSRLVSPQKIGLSGRDKSKRGGRVYNTKALDPLDLERIVKYVKSFKEDNGLALPGPVPGHHKTGLKQLPSEFTKIKIWRS
ncbi:hypothetical protein ElyMa_005606100 [Elysia marginata]|uniref:Uncharacterized protein n=1 Tax=Elysia marginata TaxID=1093978 RepID=A0AAV4F502_9GAST|nr:hypothetical protein ElyMa_005606100 [Elysia marginata]